MRLLSRLLRGTFLLAVVGTAAELVLLSHYEDAWQQVPLVVLAAGLGAALWQEIRRTPGSARLFQVTMALFIAAGMLGMLLHYQSNREFELETYPTMAGLELLRETLTGAIPALAPGALIHIGLIGFAYGYVRRADGVRDKQQEAAA
jgi:hypothetical protein